MLTGTGTRLNSATGQQVADAARRAFTDSMQSTMLIAAAVMALGALAALFTLDRQNGGSPLRGSSRAVSSIAGRA